jgi:hypothetical protein
MQVTKTKTWQKALQARENWPKILKWSSGGTFEFCEKIRIYANGIIHSLEIWRNFEEMEDFFSLKFAKKVGSVGNFSQPSRKISSFVFF